MPTFLYELPPAFAPLCELLSVGLFDACPLMKTVHEIVTESVAIVYSFHRTLVVTDLRTDNRDAYIKDEGKVSYGEQGCTRYAQQMLYEHLRTSCCSPPRNYHWRHRSWSHRKSPTSLLPSVTLCRACQKKKKKKRRSFIHLSSKNITNLLFCRFTECCDFLHYL